MEKILSVSVAAYNVESTLRETLDAFVASGVLDDLDVMIVDDGSSDGTAKLAQEYVDRYPDTFRLISKENGGWGSTVNAGIQNARGKYFRQVDGDDYYNPHNMPAYIQSLRDCETDMVITPYVSYDDATREILSHENCNPGCELWKWFELKDIGAFAPFMHSLAVKTECIRDKVQVTEHCFYTDTEFVLKVCNHVRTVAFFDMEIYCYRRTSVGQSMSLAGMEKHYGEQTIVIDTLLDYMGQEVQRPEVKAIYDNLLLGTCCWQYLVFMYIEPTSEHKRDLIAYDKMIRERAPEYYGRIGSRVIDMLRKTHFMGYSLVARYKKKKDNRFTEDGRMLW